MVSIRWTGAAGLETLMALHGMPERVTVCNERIHMNLPGGASVTLIPSLHGLVLFGCSPYPGEIDPAQRPPLKTSDYRHGRIFNIRLEIGGTSFLDVGTANLIDSELEGQTCDVLFLCMPGWKKIPEFHGRILSRVRPKIVVPFHFDDFFAPLSKDGRAPSVPWRAEKGFLDKIAGEAPDARIIRPDLLRPMVF